MRPPMDTTIAVVPHTAMNTKSFAANTDLGTKCLRLDTAGAAVGPSVAATLEERPQPPLAARPPSRPTTTGMASFVLTPTMSDRPDMPLLRRIGHAAFGVPLTVVDKTVSVITRPIVPSVRPRLRAAAPLSPQTLRTANSAQQITLRSLTVWTRQTALPQPPRPKALPLALTAAIAA